MTAPRVVIADDEQALVDLVATALAEHLAVAVPHHLVLTGGGVGTRVLERLAVIGRDIDWSGVHLWWGDERFLPPGDPERNETAARRALIDHVPIPEAHVHPMPADHGQGVEVAALAYADELARHAVDGFVPDFDLLLLGMGPDGHIASLFPGMPALDASSSTCAVTGSPKPPPQRTTLTLRAIRTARMIWIGATGSSKAGAAAHAVRADVTVDEIPAIAARGREATVIWLDQAAASLL